MGCAHRALDPAQRIAGNEVVESRICHQQLIGRRCEALAQRGRLSGHVVGSTSDGSVGVLHSERGKSLEHGDGTVTEQKQRLADLKLFDVLSEVSRRHAQVHGLVTGECVELLDPRLDVVLGDALAGRN